MNYHVIKITIIILTSNLGFDLKGKGIVTTHWLQGETTDPPVTQTANQTVTPAKIQPV